MKDITILIPLHEISEEGKTIELLKRSINSFSECKKLYQHGSLFCKIVCPEELVETIKQNVENTDVEYLVNKGEHDFCSQVNYGVENIETEYFSILEYDDEFSAKWFNMAHDYYFTNEDVSVFLPINIQYDAPRTMWQYCNELVWASSFSEELGYINFECLENCSTFNLTGGIFNTEDFKKIGGLKPSIQVAFNYEFLLRATNKKLKIFVVPKEGYYHLIGSPKSLTTMYLNTYEQEDIKKWFDLAKQEYLYTEDRKVTIGTKIEEELK